MKTEERILAWDMCEKKLAELREYDKIIQDHRLTQATLSWTYVTRQKIFKTVYATFFTCSRFNEMLTWRCKHLSWPTLNYQKSSYRVHANIGWKSAQVFFPPLVIGSAQFFSLRQAVARFVHWDSSSSIELHYSISIPVLSGWVLVDTNRQIPVSNQFWVSVIRSLNHTKPQLRVSVSAVSVGRNSDSRVAIVQLPYITRSKNKK